MLRDIFKNQSETKNVKTYFLEKGETLTRRSLQLMHKTLRKVQQVIATRLIEKASLYHQ